MADHCSLSLLTTMDRLWFHQIILFPPDCSSSTPLNPLTSTTSLQLPLSNVQHQQETPTIEKEEERATGMNPDSTVRSRRSESPLTEQRRPENIKGSSSTRELDCKYSMISCKSLRELEMEEVKGFIDLGFKFNKQSTNPRIARLIPGLLKFLDSDFNKFDDEDQEQPEKENDDYEEEEEEKVIIRPYLSEAWLVNRRNLQLLNLKLPLGGVSASASSDMKKHLKFWARNVACVIHQQS